ncbi:MAG TPA: Uma2 family endonuclease [Phototrophicaceae bacterium]|nr:Uma2 family endonuclease [Phototrophicaceae bacterium]
MANVFHTREKVTLEEFKQFVEQPENSDRLFELIYGEIIEVMPATTPHSGIHSNITGYVRPFCREHRIPCYTTNGDGSYDVQGNVVAPDFAYKQTPLINTYPDPEPPVWAVEVISINDKAKDIRNKREIYRAAGVLLWEIYPDDRVIDVYAPGQAMQTYKIDDTIDLNSVIAGFKLTVREIFEG